ncbi:MAG: methyltransferase [Spirochaetaceae bacterium]|jgi:23S rRNA (uracil1939-C5)-methyltransferase|nr:methyltransferase [Spirochaetaceae bacterium]
MRTGEIFTASVERLAKGGAGILHYQGKTVFMDKTAPGDTVVGRIQENRAGWARAELVEITAAAPVRAAPACPAYGRCGGCSLQHLSYEAQAAEKSAALQETLARIGGLTDLPELGVHLSPAFEYRNRLQFHRIPGGPAGTPAAGLKARAPGEAVPLEDCPVADPAIRRALQEKTLAPPPEKERFTVYARGGAFLCEGGVSRGKVRLLDRELLIDAGVFFQSNAVMLEKVILRLRELGETAGGSGSFADVYCGVGTFAAFLRDLFSQADLVEQDKAALGLANENVPGRPVRRIALPAEAWLRNTPRLSYDFMVLDPPRRGLSPYTRRRLSQDGPPLMAYLSCDPAALARDAREILRGGYTLAALDFYDFYPQTGHIESLAVFQR